MLREPAAEQARDLILELVGCFEAMERGKKLALAVAEPALEVSLQSVPLFLCERERFAVAERHQRFRSLAEDVNIGDHARLARFKRGQHLIGRAAGIKRAIGHLR